METVLSDIQGSDFIFLRRGLLLYSHAHEITGVTLSHLIKNCNSMQDCAHVGS